MKKLPLGIQSFEKMILQNYLYVDKTEYIYNLITSGTYYFLSRPRRFGKSLLVSTLKELFLGNKELFKGLWIDKNTDYDWQEYPVIDLDFSRIPHLSSQELRRSINNRLEDIALNYGISGSKKEIPEETLAHLITQLSKKNKVIILIDEYDKPILDHIKNIEEAEAQREILRSFYTVIKGMDKYIHFVLLTGVTKIGQTSIFSGLNNLNDITMKPEAATLLGYAQQELENNFGEYLERFAQEKQTTVQGILDQMRTWYNGYCFTKNGAKVYNPFSVTYCLHDKDFANYWIKSGTPNFLIDLISKNPQELKNIEKKELGAGSLEVFSLEKIHLVSVLFQTGYYTIHSYNPETNRYLIGYPNREVQESFTEYLMIAFTHTDIVTVQETTSQCRTALLNKDLESFCDGLRTLFAHIPYNLHIKREAYYHSLFQLLGTMLQLETTSEVATDKGRVDVVIVAQTYIYIFEVKFNKELGEGIEQIERKRYYEKYKGLGKPIVLVEMLFTRTEKDFAIDYKVKDLV